MAQKRLYRGFSTHQYDSQKSFSVSDIQCVELDLLNHIYTSRGERLMMPNFGTRIPTLVFEPLDDITLTILEEDLRAVFEFDPRVSLEQLVITPSYDTNTVTAAAQLRYLELNMSSTLTLNLVFDGNSS